MSTPLPCINPRDGTVTGHVAVTSATELDTICIEARSAHEAWAGTSAASRAGLLNALAQALYDQRDQLVPLADEETALGSARLQGELDRTVYQLRRMAQLAEAGIGMAPLNDAAVAGAPPVGHPALQRRMVPLGPVAMFSASNFPLAFSVLGGDTASALAAGCAVVAKAHPSHLRLSTAVHALAVSVLASLQVPKGLLGLVIGGQAEGVQLVQHPEIAAVAFTGSAAGGMALARVAAQRPVPIPFFGELGSVNPVVALPKALVQAGDSLAQALAASIAQGCGQFCTSPGIVVLCERDAIGSACHAVNDGFVAALASALQAQNPHEMLNPGIRAALQTGVGAWLRQGAHPLTPLPQADALRPCASLMSVSAEQFLASEVLRHEVFGPACLVVRAPDAATVRAVLNAVGGCLTITLWGVGDAPDTDERALVRVALQQAGRVLFTGVPTGVAVTAGQHHGGPWPASTRPEATSVGDAAVQRFVRPVCLQDAPDWLTNHPLTLP